MCVCVSMSGEDQQLSQSQKVAFSPHTFPSLHLPSLLLFPLLSQALTGTVRIVWFPSTRGTTGDHTGVALRGIARNTGEVELSTSGVATRECGDLRGHIATDGWGLERVS